MPQHDEPLAQRLVNVLPSERQLLWQQNEFTAFLHFGVNTFTGREWGDGTESPSLFAPTALDTDQWCTALKSAGIRACILTAKHHDGFCLWHTKQTTHSVTHSPFGKDIAVLLSESCKRYGLKLGFYLSPWDRHEASYGSGKAYDDFFCAQLEELLTGYGPLYCLWFDGACGVGPNGRRQRYDWDRYYTLIRSLQPGAAISICGPDVRWCGNEAGDTRDSEWSVVPAALQDVEKIQKESQQADDTGFREQGAKSTDRDLGSRAALTDVQELCWYPAEVDVSIRPGWFYHLDEDNQLKSLDDLLNLYTKSVGGNSVLLLNIPPDTRGLIAEADVIRLRELGEALHARFQTNKAPGTFVYASSEASGHPAEAILQDDESYWTTPDGQETASITMTFPTATRVSRIILAEQLRQSQRIEHFYVYGETETNNHLLYEGTTVGFKRVCEFSADAMIKQVTIKITESRVAPTLRFVGIF